LPLRRDPPSGRDLDDGTVSQLFEEFRNVAAHRDPAVILIDQLKEIYIDATLKAIETTQWYPTVMRKEYTLAFTVTETGLDDPDQMF
jgi:peptide/nickel transport system substrate-binding protein